MRGSIVRRGKARDRWTVRFELPLDPATGKRRQKMVAVRGTRQVAQRKLNELRHLVDRDRYVDTAKITVGAFLRKWMAEYVADGVRSTTGEGYGVHVDAHLIPKLGRFKLAGLKPAHLQQYYSEALKSGRRDGKGGLAAQTVKHHHVILSQAFKHAVRAGLIQRNVCEFVSPPRVPSSEMHPLDWDGVRTLLSVAEGTDYLPLVHLAVWTGLRRSELLGLEWSWVDLDAGFLMVVQRLTQSRNGGGFSIEEPKSKAGQRGLPISESTVQVLRDHRANVGRVRSQLEITVNGRDLVFSRIDGAPLLPDSITHAIARMTKRAGYPDTSLQDLRHTHATLMLKAGVHAKIVAERLGHSSVVITLDRYSHVLPGLQEAAVKAFDVEFDAATPEYGVLDFFRDAS